MTLLAISSLTPDNKIDELNIENQKLVKGGFFNNTTDLYRTTTVSSGGGGGVSVAPGGEYLNYNVTQTGNGTILFPQGPVPVEQVG